MIFFPALSAAVVIGLEIDSCMCVCVGEDKRAVQLLSSFRPESQSISG